jgi:hypothetical protein
VWGFDKNANHHGRKRIRQLRQRAEKLLVVGERFNRIPEVTLSSLDSIREYYVFVKSWPCLLASSGPRTSAAAGARLNNPSQRPCR